jgi:hypothetical protein
MDVESESERVGAASRGAPLTPAAPTLRGQGAFGTVRETGTPGLLLKRYERESDMHREALIWGHIHARCGAHASLPYAGATEEGLLMRDGGVTLYAASAWLRRNDSALLEYILALRDALVMVHLRANVEHRDLNPLNVLARPAPGRPGHFVPSLIDLTNASLPGADRLMLARHTPRVLRASPVIRSPEETLGLDAPPFAHDAWALGVLMMWLLLGPLFGTDGEDEESVSSSGRQSPDTRGEEEGGEEDSEDGNLARWVGDEWDETEEEEEEDQRLGRAGAAFGEEDEEELMGSGTTATSGSMMDEADPFTRMVMDARAMVRFYGSPRQLKPMRRWFVVLAGSLGPVQGFAGHPLVAALRERRWARIPRAALKTNQATWRRLRVITSLLLSYDAEVRVAALHDDRLWGGPKASPEQQLLRSGRPAAPAPEQLHRSGRPPRFGAMTLPRPDFLPPPPAAPSLILARLLDDTFAGEAHPMLVRIATLLIDAIARDAAGSTGQEECRAGAKEECGATPSGEHGVLPRNACTAMASRVTPSGAEGASEAAKGSSTGQEECRAGAKVLGVGQVERAAQGAAATQGSELTTTTALYAGAVALVASGMVGYFGNGIDNVLRPRAATRLRSLAYVAHLARWLWRGGAAARVLSTLAQPSPLHLSSCCEGEGEETGLAEP